MSMVNNLRTDYEDVMNKNLNAISTTEKVQEEMYGQFKDSILNLVNGKIDGFENDKKRIKE